MLSAWDRLRRPGHRSAVLADRRQRRLFGWELLAVLALFPLPSVITAVYDLLSPRIGHIELSRGIGSGPQAGTLLPVSILAAVRISELAVVLLIGYLLTRSGEGLASIGLGGRAWRTDLALVLPVWFLVQVLPQDLGTWFVHWTVLPTYFPESVLSQNLFLGLLGSLVAGVVEETVVVGYLVRRLEQLGWSPLILVVVATLVRLSYHVYYGPGVVRLLPWAVASVLIYRWTRRLWPLVVCHVFFDVHVTVLRESHAAWRWLGVGFVVVAAVACLAWRGWRPTEPRVAAAPVG